MHLLSRRTAPRLSYGHLPRVSGPPSTSCTGMLPRHRIERRIEAEVGHAGVPAHVGHGWTTSRLSLRLLPEPPLLHGEGNSTFKSSKCVPCYIMLYVGNTDGTRDQSCTQEERKFESQTPRGHRLAHEVFRQLAENTTHRHRHELHTPRTTRPRDKTNKVPHLHQKQRACIAAAAMLHVYFLVGWR
jgi:hypothetical protein